MNLPKILKTSGKEKSKFNKLFNNNEFLKYTGISSKMIFIILAGVLLGIKIDEWLNNKNPVFLIIFTILSVVLAIYTVIKDFLSSK